MRRSTGFARLKSIGNRFNETGGRIIYALARRVTYFFSTDKGGIGDQDHTGAT